MRTNIVFTLTGPDRIGIVEAVTGLVLDHDGNVETSRMARLGGEFAVLMLISLPQERLAGLEAETAVLEEKGYRVSISRTGKSYADVHHGWFPFRIEVHGADHEGIIHEIAHYLSKCGINIESMDTGTVRAPVSGAPLFSMIALVTVPPDLVGQGWESDLEKVGHGLNVDVKVTEVTGKHLQ
ncbi:MAG: ACT domain-containing protein [Geobacteraceae bacterium]|nr:ACT domain-containing protein [Geobacteraceae bacterium]